MRIPLLFKYLRQEHADALLMDGTIRIGTLSVYRDTELGPAIGDVGEGTAETTHIFDGPKDITKQENRSWVSERFFRPKDGAKNVVIGNLRLEVPEDAPNCFIYCMTHQFSRKAMGAFGADACVQITHPGQFVETVTRVLQEKGIVGRAVLAPCDYSGRVRTEKMERINPALLKDPAYRYQHEVRLLLEPQAAGPLEPFLVSIPDLVPFCTLRSASLKNKSRSENRGNAA